MLKELQHTSTESCSHNNALYFLASNAQQLTYEVLIIQKLKKTNRDSVGTGKCSGAA